MKLHASCIKPVCGLEFYFTLICWLLQEDTYISRGDGASKGTYLALYITLADAEKLHPRTQILTKLTFRIVDQMHHKHHYCLPGKECLY